MAEWRDGCASGEITEIFACGTAAVITPIGVGGRRAPAAGRSAPASPARSRCGCARSSSASSTATSPTPSAGSTRSPSRGRSCDPLSRPCDRSACDAPPVRCGSGSDRVYGVALTGTNAQSAHLRASGTRVLASKRYARFTRCHTGLIGHSGLLAAAGARVRLPCGRADGALRHGDRSGLASSCQRMADWPRDVRPDYYRRARRHAGLPDRPGPDLAAARGERGMAGPVPTRRPLAFREGSFCF